MKKEIRKKMIRIFLLIGTLILLSQAICAQVGNTSFPDERRQREEFPLSIREMLEKRKIEERKKEYNELLQRSKEVAELGEALYTAYEKRKSLTSEEIKKLERLEKLIRKILDDLGGKSDKGEVQRLRSLDEALKFIKENTKELSSIVEKSTRFAISATAIEVSNALLETISEVRHRFGVK